MKKLLFIMLLLALSPFAAYSDPIGGGGGIYGGIYGGSSGSVASDTIFDAAGDLVQGTGANTSAVLTKGAEGTILRAGAASLAYTTATYPATTTTQRVLYSTAANIIGELAAVNNGIVGFNSTGVLGAYVNFSSDDSAYQFYSATASKGTRKLVQSSISDTMLLTDTPVITGNVTWTNISQGAGTWTRVFEEALNSFTVLQQFDATAGIKIGATGVTLTSDDDGMLIMTGAGAGAAEDLRWNFDDTANEVVVTSTTGVTAIDFSGFVLKGKINTIVDNAATTYNVSAAEASSGTFFINTNAGTKTYVLPGAAAGQMVCVKNGQGNAQVLRFDTDGTDYIVKSTGARTTAAGDYYNLSADAKNQMCAVCFDATDWYITSEVGTATEE